MSAVFSSDQTKRYRLDRACGRPLREGDTHLGSLGFMMLNPSKAGEVENDPTIRKCCGFATRWGYSGIVVANLIPLVSTNPWNLPYWNGPFHDNDQYIEDMLSECSRTVVAWGSQPKDLCRKISLSAYIYHFMGLAGDRQLYCIGLTKSGYPLHPSRAAYTTAMQEWEYTG